MFPSSSNNNNHEDVMMSSSSPSSSNNSNSSLGMMLAEGDFDGLIDLEPTPLSDVIHQQHVWQHPHLHHHQQHHNHHHQLQQQKQQQHRSHRYSLNHQHHGDEGGDDNNNDEPALSAADFFDECGLFAPSSSHNNHNHDGIGIDMDSNHRSKRRREQQSNKPGVHFSCEAMIHPSPREVDETLSAWYTREELALFKKERKDIVRALKRVNFDLSKFDCSAHCLRGLEAYSSIRFNKLMQRKREQVVKTVLGEQTRQRGFAMIDAASIREVSVRASEWARGRALELGLEDAKELGLPAIPTPSLSPEEDPTINAAWGHESGISQTSTTPSLCSSVTSSQLSDGSPAMTFGKSASVLSSPNNFGTPTLTMGKSAAMAKYTVASPASTTTTSRGDFVMHVHPSAAGRVGGAMTGRAAYELWSPRMEGTVLPRFATKTTTMTGVAREPLQQQPPPPPPPQSPQIAVPVPAPPSVVARELETSLSLVDAKPR